ncbi:hypothetical protein LCGC14_2943180, partial [marine sediment metagenome]
DGFFGQELALDSAFNIEGYIAIEEVEFLATTIATDTAQTVTTITDFTNKIWDYFSVQNKPSFAQFNDEWFIVNGAQKGVRYNGRVARSWPPNAPGEPSIIPLANTGGLDGEYLYTFRVGNSKDADSLMSSGYVSAPIRVRNGQVMLKDFIWPAADTTDPTPDTIMIFGYRTRANPGRVEGSDYAFFFDTIFLDSVRGVLDTLTYIDSIADGNLSSTDSVQLVHTDWVGRDSLGVIDVRYGAPGFLDIPVWANQGIFDSIPAQRDTLGVAYRVTFIDTINGDESGGSGRLYVWVDTDSTGNGTKKPDHIRVALPTMPDTALVYNLYRAHILQVTYDSSYETIWIVRGQIRNRQWITYLAVDTTMLAEFRLVAQISADS